MKENRFGSALSCLICGIVAKCSSESVTLNHQHVYWKQDFTHQRSLEKGAKFQELMHDFEALLSKSSHSSQANSAMQMKRRNLFHSDFSTRSNVSEKTMGELASEYRILNNDEVRKVTVDYGDYHPFNGKSTHNYKSRGKSKKKKSSSISPTITPRVRSTESPTTNPSENPSDSPSNSPVSIPSLKPKTNSIATGTPSVEDLKHFGDDLFQEEDVKREEKPIRIKFETFTLEQRMNESLIQNTRIEALINSVLPRVAEIWSTILSLVPVDVAIPIQENECYGFYPQVPPVLLENGSDNTDLLVLVSGHDKFGDTVLCSQGTLASASFCSLDQFDRPVVGFINFCLGNIGVNLEVPSSKNGAQSVFDNPDIEQIGQSELPILTIASGVEEHLVGVGVHELGHILGLSDDLFKYFRNHDTGEPLTPRPFKITNATCVDGSSRLLKLPSTNTLQLRKGTSNAERLLYYDIVTPKVTNVVRNQFNCQTLNGARLENQPTRNSCTGAHWDERLFYTEVMGPIISSEENIFVSPLTVALMEDTGWYTVDYSGPYVRNSSFGLGAGCGFIENECIDEESGKVADGFEPYFCDNINTFANGKISHAETFCDPSHSHIAYCDLFNLPSEKLDEFPELRDAQNQYFSDLNIVSFFKQADFCPIPTLFQLDCKDSSAKGNGFYAGEQYGASSKCFNAFYHESNNGNIHRSACLMSKCNEDEHLLEVIIGSQVVKCAHEGEIHPFLQPDSNQEQFFECPPLASVCPELFCPGMCSGRGKCNFSPNRPKCECFDDTDISAGCFGKDYVKINAEDPENNEVLSQNESLDNNITSGSCTLKNISEIILIIAISIIILI